MSSLHLEDLKRIDASPELIAEAGRAPGVAQFRVGNILTLPATQYDAILCRGVLNDLLGDSDRKDVFIAFGRALRPAGVLILDVREWEMTARRKAHEPIFRKTVPTERGTLTFTSVTELDPVNRRLLISECHTVDDGLDVRSYEYAFAMRCWTQAEIHAHVRAGGFASIDTFGAYDPAVPSGTTDRLVVVGKVPS